MSYYRIKIEEQNDGSRRYVPQTAKLNIMGKMWPKTSMKWENIIYEEHSRHYHTAYSMTQYYGDYDRALSVIEGYKVFLKRKNGEEVKTVTYKMVD